MLKVISFYRLILLILMIYLMVLLYFFLFLIVRLLSRCCYSSRFYFPSVVSIFYWLYCFFIVIGLHFWKIYFFSVNLHFLLFSFFSSSLSFLHWCYLLILYFWGERNDFRCFIFYIDIFFSFCSVGYLWCFLMILMRDSFFSLLIVLISLLVCLVLLFWCSDWLLRT